MTVSLYQGGVVMSSEITHTQSSNTHLWVIRFIYSLFSRYISDISFYLLSINHFLVLFWLLLRSLSGLRSGDTNACHNFVHVVRCWCVTGAYTDNMLSLWDNYHKNKGNTTQKCRHFLFSLMYLQSIALVIFNWFFIQWKRGQCLSVFFIQFIRNFDFFF